MNEQIEQANAVLRFIQQHQGAASVVLGLIFAWSMTWWLKHKVGYEGTPGRRWVIRILLATPFGALPVLLAFPAEYGWGWRISVALTVGFGSWAAFDVWAVIRDKFFPWFRETRERRRAAKEQEDTEDPNENGV